MESRPNTTSHMRGLWDDNLPMDAETPTIAPGLTGLTHSEGSASRKAMLQALSLLIHIQQSGLGIRIAFL